MTDTTVLTDEQVAALRNISAIAAIREGVRERITDINLGTSRGQVRNTARTRGYLEALQDLDRTLTDVLEKGVTNE